MHFERAMHAQPIFRSPRQAADNLIVVDGVEASKLCVRGTSRQRSLFVYLSENPANEFAVLPGKPKLRLNAFEVRIERAGEEAPAVDIERRRESRLAVIKKPRKAAERQKIPQPVGRRNIDRGRDGLHGRSLFQAAVTRTACHWTAA